MFHAASRRPVREVVNEHVVVEGSIVHPTGGRGCDFMQHAYDLCHVVVGSIGIHDHAIMPAAFVKIGFLKVAYFYGRIDQSIIIFRIEMAVLGGCERSANLPSIGHVIESHAHGRIAPIRGIHQNFREIEERVMRIELSRTPPLLHSAPQ